MPSNTAQIMPFPLERVRPGIRQLLIMARRSVALAEETGRWSPGQSGVTPSMIHKMIQDVHIMFRQPDTVVAETAIKVSLLGLHALHSGDWNDRKQIASLLDLQIAGLNLEAAHTTAMAS